MDDKAISHEIGEWANGVRPHLRIRHFVLNNILIIIKNLINNLLLY